MNLEAYIERLKKLGISTESYHWRAETLPLFKAGYKLLRKLEKKMGLTDKDHILQRACGQNRCLNPLHYNVIEKPKNILEYDKDEVEDLEPLIDVATLLDIGFRNYFEAFNTGNPLPARAVDFFVACNRRLTKKKQQPLNENLLKGIKDDS